MVYDASSKQKEEFKSFNNCLYCGPVLLSNLCRMLLRFPMHNVAIVADEEKVLSIEKANLPAQMEEPKERI